MTAKELLALTPEEDITLIGKKFAVQVDTVLYCSPALRSLLDTEQGKDRETLLKAIKVVVKEPPRRRRKYPWQ